MDIASQETPIIAEPGIGQSADLVPGRIESVTLQNFMCHDNFHVDFGHRVNFIYGQNGSGKSAVLNGIVLGLGGRSSNTNRGSGLSSFIKTGESKARVIIKLANNIGNHDKGDRRSSYCYDRYGKSIIVERSFTSNGQVSYKIKSSTGKVVSEKKEELDHILKHFSIHIDNPICVLTQEVSKNFLNSSSAADKFKFFVRATQIEDSRRDLEQAKANINNFRKIIEDKKEILQLQMNKLNEYRQSIEVIETLRNSVNKIKTLEREMLWAQIDDRRKQLDAERKKLTEHETKCEQCEEKLTDVERKMTILKTEKDVIVDRFQNISEESKKATEELDAAKGMAREVRKQLTEKESELRDKKNNLNLHSREIEDLKSTIFGIERDSQECNVANLETRIENLTKEIDTLNNQEKELRNEARLLHEESEELRKKRVHYNEEERKIAAQITGFQTELDRLNRSQQNRLSRYGSKYPELNAQIDSFFKQGRFKHKPLGPIGEYIRLEDYSAALAVECFLGKTMFAYVVDNGQDANVLKSLVGRIFHGQNVPMIIVRKFVGLHDVSHRKVVSHRHLNFLRLLNIDSQYDPVANCLIDHHNIEQVLYIPDFDEAQRTLIRREHVPKNCRTAYTQNGDLMYPTTEHCGYKCYPNKRLRFTKILVQDQVQAKQQHQRSIEELKKRQIQCHENGKKISEMVDENKKKLADIQGNINEIQLKKTNLDCQLIQLKAKASVKPVETQAMKDELTKLESERDKIEKEIAQLLLERKKLSEQYVTLENDVDTKNKEYHAVINSREPMRLEIEKKDAELQEQEQNLRYFQKEKEKLAKIKHDQQHELSRMEEMVLKDEESANVTGERIETTRTSQQISNEIKRIQMIIQDNQQMSDVEEQAQVYEQYRNLREALHRSTTDLRRLQKYFKLLKISLIERERAFFKMQLHITELINYYFLHFLKQKEFKGNIYVYFAEQTHLESGEKKRANTLEIEIKPLNDEPIDGSQSGTHSYSSTKSLSGGERSFSTVAFIMSLWQICHSPFKILDEVDVFMDIVTRKISVDALVEFAATKSNNQYIFLSPLQLQQFSHMESIKIFHMPEPERIAN